MRATSAHSTEEPEMFATADPEGFAPVVPGVRRKTLCWGLETLMAEFRLDGGYELPQHAHPHEQTGYLVSGRLRMTIGEETRDLAAGDSWCIAGDVVHGAHILEDAVAVEVFSPRREDFLPGVGAGGNATPAQGGRGA